jgi:hypothetical protein
MSHVSTMNHSDNIAFSSAVKQMMWLIKTGQFLHSFLEKRRLHFYAIGYENIAGLCPIATGWKLSEEDVKARLKNT